MIGQSFVEGEEAFGLGLPRITNPHDASSEEWLNWRDGWEQAKAAAARFVHATVTEAGEMAT